MKLLIKTTLFASLMVVLAMNSSTISHLCVEKYNDYVSYLLSNGYVPNGF